MDFRTFRNCKDGHFSGDVLQKSKFGIDEYPILIGTDFGLILRGFGTSFGTKKLPKSMPRCDEKTHAILEGSKILNPTALAECAEVVETSFEAFNAKFHPILSTRSLPGAADSNAPRIPLASWMFAKCGLLFGCVVTKYSSRGTSV